MFKALVAFHSNADAQNNADPFSFDAFDDNGDGLDAPDWTSALTPVAADATFSQSSSVWSTGFTPITLGYQWGAGSRASTGSSSGSGVIVSTSGSGLVFDNTYASGDTADYEACIVAAEKQLEGLFTNSITLNITFKESDEGDNGVASGNSWSTVNVSYASLKSKLPSIDIDKPLTDPTGGAGFTLPEAYARLLGLSSGTPSVDDTVTLNTYYGWSFGQDVINAMTHELTEGGMGRVGGLGDQNSAWSTMDLFRFSAVGTPDYTDGRDGKTTYFSPNGIDLSSKGVPSLSFNNEYDSSGTQVNTGDTADWNETAVFGTTYSGETLTLTQTELDVMEALGWDPTIQQDVLTESGDWETPTAWSEDFNPISPQDAYIGISGTVDATSDDEITVNSIGTNSASSLTIGNFSTFTATDGTVANPSSVFTFGTANSGTINVDIGSALVIGSTTTFDNAGTLNLGVGVSGASYLDLGGTVTLTGGGTVQLGKNGVGDIRGVTSGSGGLVNVNNTIAGNGSIYLASFDNQEAGAVEANSNLQIIANTTFSNEGRMVAEANATLDLGEDGFTQSLANTGTILLEAAADLAISGTFTISGSGAVDLKGAGAEITSDQDGPTTLTNESSIAALNSGQIGDLGKTLNDLTFNNTGTVSVALTGATLTLDTGSRAIGDGGGTLEAEDSAILVIDSIVDTGVPGQNATAGTVQALSGGVVRLAASIVDGIAPPTVSTNGQVVINAGTFDMLAGSSDTATVEFQGSSGTLELDKASTTIGAISGFASGDLIELKGFDVAATESVAADVLTIKDGGLSQVFDLTGATYSTAQFGVVQNSGGFDILSFQTSFTGGGYTLDLAAGSASLTSLSNTAGVWDLVEGADGTVDLTSAQTAVVGAGDTIVFAGGPGNEASLYDTGGSFDLVSGSSGIVFLESAQAAVSGGDDVIYFKSASGNAASLYNTAGHSDYVGGSNGTVYLNSAQASIAGGGDTINFTSGVGNAATLSGTAGAWDTVNGSNGTVYLVSAQAVVTGGADVIDFNGGSGNAVTVSSTAGHWDTVNGSNGTVYFTNGGQAVITGGADAIDFVSGAGDSATLSGTAGHWDTVHGTNGIVYLTSGQAVVTGGASTVNFVSGSGNAATLSSTGGSFDLVNATGGMIYLSSAQSAVTGGGNSMQFVGGSGNAVSLYSTGGDWDSVTGSSGTVYLNSAQAGVAGSSDKIDMSGTSTVTQSGASDAFVFQAAIGVEKINGFDSTDSMQFSASDFANFSALMSHTTQSGSATVIKLDSTDKVTLTNTLDTSLVASQFHFV